MSAWKFKRHPSGQAGLLGPAVAVAAASSLLRLFLLGGVHADIEASSVVWQVETPCGVADCTFVDPTKPVKVCCIC